MNTFNDWYKKQDPSDILSIVAVPKKTYETVATHQLIWYDREKYKFFDGESPVALRGAMECRIAKYRNQSSYLSSLWTRYIRMKKITCVNRSDWVKIAYNLPRPRRHYYSNSIDAARPIWMVFNNRVLIKGKSYEIENPERLKIVKDVFGQVTKLKLP